MLEDESTISHIAWRAFWVTTAAWIAVVAVLLLSAIVLLVTGHRADLVATPNMEPAIPFNSLAILEDAKGSEIEVGDVIVYRDPTLPENSVLHRVIRVTEDSDSIFFETQGDANAAPDPVLVPSENVERRLVASNRPLGRVISSIREPFGLPIFIGVVLYYALTLLIIGGIVAAVTLAKGRGSKSAEEEAEITPVDSTPEPEPDSDVAVTIPDEPTVDEPAVELDLHEEAEIEHIDLLDEPELEEFSVSEEDVAEEDVAEEDVAEEADVDELLIEEPVLVEEPVVEEPVAVSSPAIPNPTSTETAIVPVSAPADNKRPLTAMAATAAVVGLVVFRRLRRKNT